MFVSVIAAAVTGGFVGSLLSPWYQHMGRHWLLWREARRLGKGAAVGCGVCNRWFGDVR